MKVSCQSCNSVLNIDDKKIPPGGARIKCPSCQNVFPVKPPPASSSPALVPLPGISAAAPQRQEWEDESTRVAEVPIPAAAIPGATTLSAPPTNVKMAAIRSSASGAVPLPGISAAAPQRQDWEDEATRVGDVAQGLSRKAVDVDQGRTAAIPSISLPGGHTAHTAHTAVAPAYAPKQSAPVPLPGGFEAATALAPAHVPAPPKPPTRGAVPLPGGFAAAPAAPVRHASASSAVPLPGTQGVPLDDGFSTNTAIPLDDGFSTNTAIPLDEGFETNSLPLPDFALPPMPPPAGARPPPAPPPLPKARGAAVPLPGPSSAQRTDFASAAAVPLPGPSNPQRSDFASAAAVPLPGATEFGFDDAGGVEDATEFDISGPSGAVPLPGSGASAQFDPEPAPSFGGPSAQFEISSPSSTGFDPPPAAPEYGGGFDFSETPAEEPAPDAGGFGFDAPPPPPAPASGGFDFDAPPAHAPVPEPESFGFDAPPAPAPGGFGFDPPAPGPDAFSFDAPPEVAAPAPGGFDFAAAPASGPSGFAFDAPAAPPPPLPPPSMGFGEVDFGGGGDLEFDPSSAPKPALDDLEADLSAPLPEAAGPAGPTDGLEMLSFIDKTAKEAGAKPDEMLSVRRFHVKRRSGKVFGPFEEAVIVKMLEDGQLLGNEELSMDTESWHAIGTEPALQAVIARLMEAPARTETQAQLQAVTDRGPSMDRLKQLYEGRMAAVAVVHSKEPVPFKKRLPYLIAGVLAATFLVGGVMLGVATPYGFFALKVLFPSKVRPDTREFGYLQAARKGFLQDTWKSYNQAKDSANQALQIKDYPEARAVWCQAVFYLDRKFGKADPAELEQAQQELVNVRLLGEKHLEVLKTEASAALSRKDADAALATIADAVARDGEDLESLFLRAEAYLLKKQPAQAKGEFEAILKKDPKSAKALHGLGMLHKQQNEVDEAAAKLAEALAADPTHLVSAVELAEIEILRRKEVERGDGLLEKALSDEGRPMLSAAALGKGLALKAETLVVQRKLTEALPLFEAALKADPSNPFTNGRMAHAYSELNQPEKAAPLYQVALRTQPESLEFTEGYLSALIILGKMDEATSVMASANTRFPGNATLAYLSARVADVLDNPKDAEEAYKRAIAADPKIIDAYLFLSRLYMRFRRFQEAGPILEAGLTQAPDHAAMRVGMGELALHERNLERAENEFKKALELDKYSSDAHLGASRVSLDRGKFELAAAQVDQALALNPRIPGGKLQRGVALWKLGRLDEAITELDAAHEAEPKSTQVVVTLGAVKFDKGDFNGALAHLNSALIAEPTHADANFFLSRVKNAKSEHTQAIEAMKRALDLNSKNPLYLYWYGRILADARKSDDAIVELKHALEVEPKYADPLEAMGRIYFERNDFKQAVRYYQQALDADPSRLAIRALIGDAQMKMEDWTGAIMSYMQALEADPDLKQAYSRLGQAYQEKKQWPPAIQWFKKAIEAEPENAEAWAALGYLFKDTGKKKDAVTAFKKYLELRPEAENKKEVDEEIYFLQGK